LTIDDWPVDGSRWNVSLTTSEELFCYGKQGILEGWSKGMHIFIETHHIYETLSDGMDTYETGDYIFEFHVNVK
jgi:hypothetical protein